MIWWEAGTKHKIWMLLEPKPDPTLETTASFEYSIKKKKFCIFVLTQNNQVWDFPVQARTLQTMSSGKYTLQAGVAPAYRFLSFLNTDGPWAC